MTGYPFPKTLSSRAPPRMLETWTAKDTQALKMAMLDAIWVLLYSSRGPETLSGLSSAVTAPIEGLGMPDVAEFAEHGGRLAVAHGAIHGYTVYFPEEGGLHQHGGDSCPPGARWRCSGAKISRGCDHIDEVCTKAPRSDSHSSFNIRYPRSPLPRSQTFRTCRWRERI